MSNHGGGRANRDKMRHQPRNHSNPPSLNAPLFNEKRALPPQIKSQSSVNITGFLKNLTSPLFRRAPDIQKPQAPKAMPIDKHEAEIIRAIQTHDDVIIIGPMGCGKTSGTPRMVNKAGFPVILINPRRLPASQSAEWEASRRNETVGESVGYCHGLASAVSPGSNLIHMTEAFFFAKQLHDPLPSHWVIISDEIHERTANSALIRADRERRRARGEQVNKMIHMTGTPDIEMLKRLYPKAPIIKVDVPRFQIDDRKPGESIAQDAMDYASSEGAAIVFCYGKRPINELASELILMDRKGRPAPKVIPLHSELSYDQQKLALDSYPEGKVVLSTNTGQTSLTIPDLKVAIISGKVRRLEIDQDGIPTLTLSEISRAEAEQQRGRVGRTSPGIAINHGRNFKALEPHAPHEIKRISLAGYALRLGTVGLTLWDMNRYLSVDERIPEAKMQLAYQELRHLRLWGSKDITSLGLKASQFPVQPRIAKLLARAIEVSVKSGTDIVGHAIDIAAVIEARGITTKDLKEMSHLAPCYGSEHIFQANLFKKAHGVDASLLAETGISASRVARALDYQDILRRSMRKIGVGHEADTALITEPEAKLLLQVIVDTWSDRAFQFKGQNQFGEYVYKPLFPGSWATVKRLRTIIGGARLIVADRLNIQNEDYQGRLRTEHQLLGLTRIDDDTLGILENARPDDYAGLYKEGISDAFRKESKHPTREKKRDRRFLNPQHRNRGRSPR